jgi:hypothetical protein
VIELYKNTISSIKKSNHDKKKIKGIYCSSEEKLWFCDVDRLYFKHQGKDKVFNLERIEKIYNYFDTTQLLAYEESGNYLYYLSDACNFIRISLDKLSNNVREFAKNITSISPKPIRIFSGILEYDKDVVLDSKVLSNLFDGKN